MHVHSHFRENLAICTVVLGCIMSTPSQASDTQALVRVGAVKAAETSFSHQVWDQVLKRTVTNQGGSSLVNYTELKKAPQDLESYLAKVQAVTREQFAAWSESERLAFLINAYNALTVKLMIDNWPVKSIRDIGWPFPGPWGKKFFTLFGEKRTLDDIEHRMVRKDFSEPRIHFALVCASKGCPPLLDSAFTAEQLEAQLNAAAARFLADSEKNQWESGKPELRVSSIFKWYGDDFKAKHGSFRNFIAPFMAKNETEQSAIRDPKTSLKFLDYDWSANGH